jgi:hypothetical protein
MVSWGASSGMVFDIPPPVAGKMWTFSPKAPATGIIYVSYSSQSQVLNDTLYAFFAPSTKRNFTAWANDNINRQTGIDNDDFVLLSFDTAVEVFSVSADNIDSLLHLSNGHSWLDGAGFIGSAQWNSAGTKLLITLSTQTALPTIRTNDTITCSSVQNKAVLTGSFDPSVLSEAGMQPIAPARLIFVVQSRFAAKGLIFIFSSPAINGMKIKIFDMFGRLVSNCNVQNMQRGRSNHFMWDNKKNGSHSRMARGIYCAQVFRKDVLIQNIPFFIK